MVLAPVFLGIFLQKTLNVGPAHTALSEVLQAELFPQVEPSRVSCCGLGLEKTRKKGDRALGKLSPLRSQYSAGR